MFQMFPVATLSVVPATYRSNLEHLDLESQNDERKNTEPWERGTWNAEPGTACA
jgi:hypothetical protein